MCPGLVGGSQGTALTALDYRCKFRRIPNLFSDGDGVCGNIDECRIYVFPRGSKGGKTKFLKTALDNGLPIPSFGRALQ
jgi:hypothetical protein